MTEEMNFIRPAYDPIVTATTDLSTTESLVPVTDPLATQPAPVVTTTDVQTVTPTAVQTTSAAVDSPEQVSVSVDIVEMKDGVTPVNGAQVTLLDKDGNIKSSSQLDPKSNSFTVWTVSPDTDNVVIAAKGFQTTMYSFADLEKEPVVYLTKSQSVIAPLAVALLAVAAYRYARSKKKVGAISTGEVITALIALAGGYVLIRGTGLIDSVLEFLHLKTSADTQSVDQAISESGNSFDPNFWRSYTTFPHGALTEQQAADLAEQIYSSEHWYSDDFDQAFGAIKQCRSKSNVSFVAWEFQKQYQLDLLGYLRHGNNLEPLDGFSDTHIAEILNYVKSLPNN